MQPDEQQDLQSQQPPAQNNSAPPSMPYQTPDYLHLDPIAINQQSPNKSRRFLLVGLAIALLAIVVLVIFFVVKSQTSPEDRLSTALEKNMATSYVSRKLILVSDDSKTKITATAESDFSDPLSPKTKIDYTYSQPSLSSTTLEKQFNMSGSIVNTSNTQFYGKITTAPSDGLSGSTQLGKWYAFSSSGSSTFDPLSLATYFNSVINVVPLGNFSTDIGQMATTALQTNKVYSIENSSNEGSVTTYKIKLDSDTLTTVASEILGSYGRPYTIPPMTSDIVTPINMKVDNTSGKVTQISYKLKRTGDKTATLTVDLTYPDKVSIEAPEAKQ